MLRPCVAGHLVPTLSPLLCEALRCLALSSAWLLSLAAVGCGRSASCLLPAPRPSPGRRHSALGTFRLDGAPAVVRSRARCPLLPCPPAAGTDWLLLCPPSPALRERPSSPGQLWGPLPSPGGLCPPPPPVLHAVSVWDVLLEATLHQQRKGLQSDPSEGVPHSPSSPAPRCRPGKVRPSPSSSLWP